MHGESRVPHWGCYHDQAMMEVVTSTSKMIKRKFTWTCMLCRRCYSTKSEVDRLRSFEENNIRKSDANSSCIPTTSATPWTAMMGVWTGHQWIPGWGFGHLKFQTLEEGKPGGPAKTERISTLSNHRPKLTRGLLAYIALLYNIVLQTHMFPWNPDHGLKE